MAYPQEYINYLVHFHGDRDYFECHEELEELWKQDPKEERKDHLVAFIQIAVALYHQRRGNFNGAYKMMSNAITIIEKKKEAVTHSGLHPAKLLTLLNDRLTDIENSVSYKSFNLPINDSKLVEVCKKKCESLGLEWGSIRPVEDVNIIDKHKRRDRSDVIAEREKQKILKTKKRDD
ncbi:DUF309 domain-containing protein [Bacillus sp. PS06]|uniref:DUF309 domain-containing protein n=1 Tax=Bacillus sp. PS06 TaxID=2764176 RepID=UPI00177C08FB|nr:DUF309 domain-containing protein [Bacillus sp. PS06]MBD8070314.1 DUF309 domain-containing protein [Bacillus sp. PS06]